uniref:Uncharacterized protein n=1 Tax=Arundo donax TaxID=35708 RepID=A0A0A9HJW7_ARUDO
MTFFDVEMTTGQVVSSISDTTTTTKTKPFKPVKSQLQAAVTSCGRNHVLNTQGKHQISNDGTGACVFRAGGDEV